jgi:AraC family transcriptional regulator, arabinose operon regulatory protein
MKPRKQGGSLNNMWHGLGRQHIEIPKPVLKSKIHHNQWLNQLYVISLGYYPNANRHYTYRKEGLGENIFFYCVDGVGWYTIKDKAYKVYPNEFFILPKNMEHSYGSDDKNPWTIYWVHFGGDALSVFNSMNIVRHHFKPHHVKASKEIIAVFTKMYKALEAGYSIENLMFANMCLMEFVSLFLYQEKHFISEAPVKTDCVDSAIAYMQKKLCENITLEDLSKESNYSVSRFSNLFRQKTGYAPIDYFIQMKMQRASQQLDFTDKSIKDIAYGLGFDDPYYFSRMFKKVIGMSPLKYRAVKKG